MEHVGHCWDIQAVAYANGHFDSYPPYNAGLEPAFGFKEENWCYINV
jgi:hypothetical protein